MTVQVKFPMSEDIWNTVIVDNGENEYIEEISENSSFFIVTYHSQATWELAMARFEGMIEHEVL